MDETINHNFPKTYVNIDKATKIAGFDMASNVLTCSLLKTLAGSKPGGNFLELGTGTGLSTSWILDGMDENSSLTSIDNESKFLAVADQFLGSDTRLDLVTSDGGNWIEENANKKFDYIFADTWAGKYTHLEEALAMLNKGGIFIIDDMLPQPNWPNGHDKKALKLIADLEKRDDLKITKLNWSTGIIIATKN
jgi:predicted O-methyltransferase YrrM